MAGWEVVGGDPLLGAAHDKVTAEHRAITTIPAGAERYDPSKTAPVRFPAAAAVVQPPLLAAS
jgi:hypothetical protein